MVQNDETLRGLVVFLSCAAGGKGREDKNMKENETNVMSRGELARRYFLLVVSLKATALSLGS